MTDKELKVKILAEIERRMEFHKERKRPEDNAIQDVLYGVISFINSLPEKPVSEELEVVSYRFACKCHPLKTEYSTSSPNPEVIEAFKAGARWQEGQIEEALLSEVLPCFMHGGEADEVVAKLDEVLNQKK